jgi:hypothetical protein
MIEKSEWQSANRELAAEDRRRLGDPPTAEEMLAYSRGELSEAEEERIQDLLVAYPELARMYSAPFAEEPRPGDADAVRPDEVAAGWDDLQRRLGTTERVSQPAETEGGRVIAFRRYLPTAVAAALALVFFGLFVQSESRARYHARQAALPRLLGAPQELTPGGTRGPGGTATMLRKDGEAYLLKPRLINEVRYPHYQIELRDAGDAAIWTNKTAHADEDDAFQIVIPHTLLRDGEHYRVLIFGADGTRRELVGEYKVRVAAE